MTLRGDGARISRVSSAQAVAIARRSFGNPNEAMDRLFELFPDKYPVMVSESSNDWTFELSWPRHILEPIDPLLSERARTCFGLELSELDKYIEVRSHRDIPFVFSMFHSYALLAPALAMQSTQQMPEVVVHVDAHHDLSPSLLSPKSLDTLVNDRFDIQVRLDEPGMVEQAIHAGFVNKASFLTAFVTGAPGRRICHVDRSCTPAAFSIHSTHEPVTIGDINSEQQAPILEPIASSERWDLFELAELRKDFPTIAGQRIWLDVDLDAFCNRFDGDSDHCDRCGSRDELKIMLEHMGDFLGSLSEADWLKDVRAVSVAASPGFFPSEYWDASIPIVCEGIANLL